MTSASLQDMGIAPPSKGGYLKRWLWCVGGALFIVSLPSLRSWGEHHAIVLNASESLPNKAFWVEVGVRPVKGEFLMFDAPASTVLKAHFGVHPPAFGKLALGVAGDRVTHRGADVYINGRWVAHMKPRTRKGYPLIPGSTGIVPQGCYYAGSSHPDGFDSRYSQIGFVCGKQIMGKGYPIL